jgi:hypothetical protein
MKLAICGPGQAGKDTVAEWLRDHTCFTYHQSTSQAAAELIFNTTWGSRYADIDECFADRRNHRKRWADTIWKYNEPDGLTLYRNMVKANDILNGIRKAAELKACVDNGLVDLSIWIDRPGTIEVGSMTLTSSDCDIILPNHGTLEVLFLKLSRFVQVLGLVKQGGFSDGRATSQGLGCG